jgi:hypothetical protein
VEGVAAEVVAEGVAEGTSSGSTLGNGRANGSTGSFFAVADDCGCNSREIGCKNPGRFSGLTSANTAVAPTSNNTIAATTAACQPRRTWAVVGCAAFRK